MHKQPKSAGDIWYGAFRSVCLIGLRWLDRVSGRWYDSAAPLVLVVLRPANILVLIYDRLLSSQSLSSSS